MNPARPVLVAAAVIRRADGGLLLAQRRPDAHQGGLWEFPGGKVEAGESIVDALARELAEELGIHIERATPLIRIAHAYPDKRVDIVTLEVRAWRGEPHGREGQPVRWVAPSALAGYRFPAANLPIVSASLLPRAALLVCGRAAAGLPDREMIETAVAAGARLIRLDGDPGPSARLASLIASWRERGVRVMVDGGVARAAAARVDGAHLATVGAMLPSRAERAGMMFRTTVRDPESLARAAVAGFDFVYAAADLGEDQVTALIDTARLPVYAPARVLGPLRAWRAGCQGSVMTVPDPADAASLIASLAELERGVPAVTVSRRRG